MIIDKLNFLESKESLSRSISGRLEETCVISTINPNVLTNMYIDGSYRDIINRSEICVCDGTAVLIVNNLISTKKTFLYPGPDLFYEMLFSGYTHCFIGATSEILYGLREHLIGADESFSQAVFLPLPFTAVSEFDYEGIAKVINKNSPDLIWVSLGAPKQDIFMHLLRDHLNRGVLIGVGAAFRFYSGVNKARRAPLLIRRVHLEWMFRLFDEPKKTSKRLLNNLHYLPLIIFKEILDRGR